jgi:hypothetical protein
MAWALGILAVLLTLGWYLISSEISATLHGVPPLSGNVASSSVPSG